MMPLIMMKMMSMIIKIMTTLMMMPMRMRTCSLFWRWSASRCCCKARLGIRPASVCVHSPSLPTIVIMVLVMRMMGKIKKMIRMTNL